MDVKDEYKNIYKFKKNEIRRYEFYINKENAKLLDWFNSVPNKQALILELLEKERKKQSRKAKENNGEKI